MQFLQEGEDKNATRLEKSQVSITIIEDFYLKVLSSCDRMLLSAPTERLERVSKSN